MFDEITKQFDDMLKQLDKSIERTMKRVDASIKDVTKRVEQSRRNRVKKIHVYDDLGRKAGTIERVDAGWAWTALNLRDSQAAQTVGVESKLKTALTAMLNRLHG